MLTSDIYALIAVVVHIYWTEPRISVTEGDVVSLSVEALGSYAIPLEVSPVCTESSVTGIEPGR